MHEYETTPQALENRGYRLTKIEMKYEGLILQVWLKTDKYILFDPKTNLVKVEMERVKEGDTDC